MFSSRIYPICFLLFVGVVCGQEVTRVGLLREFLGSSGISRTGDAPYDLENADTWASTTGGSVTVRDTDDNDALQVVATDIAGNLAIVHSATSNSLRMEGGALRVSSANDPGQPVTWDFWIMLGDLTTDAVFFETGGGTYGASVTIGDGDVRGDDDPTDTDRRDDLRFVLGGSGSSDHLVLDMDLPNTVTSRFHYVAAVYDGQDMILYMDGVEAARHATGGSSVVWQGTDGFGLLGQGNTAIGGDGKTPRPFKSNWVGAKGVASFRWYSRGLSPEEVYANYRAELNKGFADLRLHHWKLDEAAGATEAADSVEQPLPLAVTGAVPDADGILGKAFTFSASNEHLTHVLAEHLYLPNYSLSVWAKADALGQASSTGIFNSGDSGADYQLEINADNYQFRGDSGSSVVLGPVTAEWVHLSMVQRSGQAEVFYNGVSAGSTAFPDVWFQKFQVGINRNENLAFDGSIDDVVLYSEPLTPEEIAVVHGLGRFSGIAFDDAKIEEALALNEGERLENVGAEDHIWLGVTGLTGDQGSVSGSIANRDATIVVGEDGSGLLYDGKPGELPSIVRYLENPAVYSKDATITPNSPVAQGSPTSYALTGTLPDGLSFDTTTGIISGTPTALTAETTVQVVATSANGDSSPFDVSITIGDLTPPVISITGSPRVHLEKGSDYTDEGATAVDNVDATVDVTTDSTVDTSVAGIYTVTYSAMDAAGNNAVPAVREVVVEDLAPIVSRIGDSPVSINQSELYENDPGAEVDAFPHVPLAYYSMAGHTLDTSARGYGHDGILHGDAILVTETHDQNGQSLYLDGNGDYFSVPGWKVIQGSQARTLSAWIKSDYPDGDTDYNNVIMSWGTDAPAEKWVFRIQTDDGTAGAIRLEVNGGNKVGSTVVADNQWHHVVAVLPEGANRLTDVLLYVDGVEESYTSDVNHSINTTDTSDLLIGNDTANRSFLGHIDDVAIFDVALTAQEIADYYAATALTISDNLDSINTDSPGQQVITYSATDGDARTGTATRILEVLDVTPPTISFLNNSETVTLNVDDSWNPQTDVLATDNSDGILIAASVLDLPKANLRLHLTADSLSSQLSQHGRISQWNDLSPHGHHLSQIDPIAQPEYSTGTTFSGGTLVADSLAEFSGTQGANGWHYGYREGNYPYDPDGFIPLAGGSGNGAWDATTQHWTGDANDSNGNWDMVIAAPSWIMVNRNSMHPQAVGGSIGAPQQAVRRWVSEVEGEIGIIGYFNNTSANNDGTFGRIFHNGEEKYAALTDGTRADYNVHFTVAIGDKVDFVVDDGGNGDSGSDTTQMEATILHEPVITHSGFPVVRFDGNDFLDRMDSLGLSGSPQFTVAGVLQPNNLGQFLFTGSDGGTAGEIIKFHPDSSLRYNNGNKEYFDNALNDGAWHAATWLTDTANGYGDGEFYHNGVAAVSTGEAIAADPLNIPTSDTRTLVPAALSGSGVLGEFMNGDIAELIVLDTKMDAVQLNALHFYLSSKYGLDLGANGQNVANAYDTSYTHTAQITYYAKDAAGNVASATRTVTVVGNNYPSITLLGEEPYRTALGEAYVDPGVLGMDPEDGDITDDVLIEASGVDTSTLGTYTVSYSVTDSGGRSANATRTVHVVDLTPPVIQVTGEDPLVIGLGETFVDPGINVTDNVDDAGAVLGTLTHLPVDGLVLHLDAAQIPGIQDGEKVATWPDLSGLGNDAVQLATPNSQPDFVASTATNNRPAVYFDGAGDFMEVSSVPAGGTSGRTIFAVMRPDAVVNGAIVWLNAGQVLNAARKGYNYLFTPEIGLRVNDNKMFQNDTLSTTEPSIVGVGNQANALITEAQAWKNGLELISSSSSGTSVIDLPETKLAIGGTSRYNQLAGDFYEILIYDRLLDPVELRLLQYSLQEKYGISGGAHLVDNSKIGDYIIHYHVKDTAGNAAMASRTVKVVIDTWSPVLTLVGSSNAEAILNATYEDAGVNVTDDKDSDLAGSVQTGIKDDQNQTVQAIDTSVAGTVFTITYSVEDSDGNTASISRTVTVVETDTVPPLISLVGVSPHANPVGQPYIDPGATALDNVDGVIATTAQSDVDPDTAGTYTITYSAADAEGNAATDVIRTVLVQDLSPVIIPFEGNPYELGQNGTWTDPGARAVVLPAQPVVYLPFDWNVLDFAPSGGQQDASLGTVQYSSDSPMPSGSSVEFDGSNVVTISGYNGILADNPRAVAMWVKSDPSNIPLLIGKELAHWGTDQTLQRFTLRPNQDANQTEFRVDVSDARVYGIKSIFDNQWHHVAVSYHGGTMADAVLYVDGQQEVSFYGGSEVDTPLDTVSGVDLRIGSGFIGFIDEFLLFDHALDANQVAAIYAPDSPAVDLGGEAVDSSMVGSTNVTYTATHAYGNSSTNRTVVVQDRTPPVITLNDANPLQVAVGAQFTDPGATALDAVDGDVSVSSSLEFPTTNLMGYWKLEEELGTDAIDSSNNLINGTILTGTTLAQTGVKGFAYSFDGVSGGVNLGDVDDMNQASEFTFSTWFNRRSHIDDRTNHNVYNVLLAQSSSATNDNLEIGTNGTAVQIYIDSTSGADTKIDIEAGIQDNTWYHLVFTFDGSDPEGLPSRLYINGQLVDARSEFRGALDNSDRSPLSFGQARPDSDKWGFFDGLMDETAIWTKALSPNQIHWLSKLNTIDTSKGITTYSIIYTAKDSAGNTATLTRTVIISDDRVAPVITLQGQASVTLNVGDAFTDDGATASDDTDGDISASIQTGGSVDTTTAGTYTLTYDVSDASGNAATRVTRTVVVEAPGGDNFTEWLTETGLNTHDAAEQEADADPDNDKLPNLLEYAFGSDPTTPDAPEAPSITVNGGQATLTFLRPKVAVDNTITIVVQTTEDLEAGPWAEASVTFSPSSDNSPVPDPDLERVEVTLPAPSGPKQFIRLLITR